MKAFDPHHRRCIFPKYGAIVDAAMRAKDLSSADVARHFNIDQSGPAGWRRGFGRNGPNRTAPLEALLGVKLDMSEPAPSVSAAAAKCAAGHGRDDGHLLNKAVPTDLILTHLAAIALAHGFTTTFTPTT